MSDNNSSDNENVQEKVTGNFKKKVLKWLEIDDEIRAMRAKSKELTKDKKEHEQFILNYLEGCEYELLQLFYFFDFFYEHIKK